MKKNFIAALLLIAGIATAISISSSSIDNPIYQKNGIKVTALEGSPDYPDAELHLVSPKAGVLPVGSDTFLFDVKNYQLGAQTPDANQKMCANSAKGQHIHFILDDAPYVASYSPKIGADVKPGHHVLLAFLSRSYNESLKHKKSYILEEFDAGNSGGGISGFDKKAPQLFYSRPKGEYVGDQETKRIMLDFYLVNCTLSKTGYKVRATVNGNEFMITEWKPYIIEGLPLGESKVKLELLDASNNPVKSPFNGVERTFTLKNEVGK